MQRPVVNAFPGSAIQRFRESAKGDERGVSGRTARLTHDGVERVSRDVLLREICVRALDSGCQRGGNSGMPRLLRDKIFKRRGKVRGLFGRQIEAEHLQRDEPTFDRIVRAEHGPEAAGPNLMQDTKGTTSGRRRVENGSVSGQRWYSSSGTRRVRRS
jgi:hypothetical protein